MRDPHMSLKLKTDPFLLTMLVRAMTTANLKQGLGSVRSLPKYLFKIPMIKHA